MVHYWDGRIFCHKWPDSNQSIHQALEKEPPRLQVVSQFQALSVIQFLIHYYRLCYLDLITPFLGLPIPIVLLITLCYRVDLEQRVWPHAPSSRALVLSYCFSTLAVYITDLVFLVIRKPFDGDIFIDGTNYLYAGFMGLGLVILFCTGVAWLRSMYHNGPDYTIRL